MKALPKIIFTDIDGVWTDGGMYYSDDGSEFKKFNTSDSVGVLICKYLNVEIVILTGENSNVVSKRAKKLKIEEVYLGVKNKLKLAKDICDQKKINLSETSFIGDDINDYRLLNHVGYSGCPSSASSFNSCCIYLLM